LDIVAFPVALTWTELPLQTIVFNNCVLSLVGLSGYRVNYGTIGSSSKIFEGSGSPEGSVTANIGSIYINRGGGSGTTLYIKESGTDSLGWVGK